MELCPKCRRMTAERNHYTKEIICYNRFCEQQTVEGKSTNSNISASKTILVINKAPSDPSRSR